MFRELWFSDCIESWHFSALSQLRSEIPIEWLKVEHGKAFQLHWSMPYFNSYIEIRMHYILWISYYNNNNNDNFYFSDMSLQLPADTTAYKSLILWNVVMRNALKTCETL